jgi:transposase-like protein
VRNFRRGLYLVLDARYEKVRQDGIIRSQAVQIAIGINEEGRRQILAVELANRESQTSWKDFLLELKSRGLRGVELVVSDDHPGLKRAIAQVIPEAVWQRCYELCMSSSANWSGIQVSDSPDSSS